MQRVAVVTGAARGLGREFVRQLQARGDRVIAAVRTPVEVEGATLATLDLADPASIARCGEELRGELDRVDLLIHCAGLFHGRSGQEGEDPSIEGFSLEDAEQSMRVNAFGPAALTRELWPLLQAGHRPVVASISSVWGSISANEGTSPLYYGASKAALAQLTRTVAGQGLPHGIAAIVLDPGWVKTDMGGPDAPLDAPRSIAGMLKAIDAAEPGPARLLGWHGREQSW